MNLLSPLKIFSWGKDHVHPHASASQGLLAAPRSQDLPQSFLKEPTCSHLDPRQMAEYISVVVSHPNYGILFQQSQKINTLLLTVCYMS